MTSQSSSPACPPLSQALRDALRQLHQDIERLPLPQAIVHGEIERSSYTQLLRQMVAVHACVESIAENAVGSVFESDMRRIDSLLTDLAFLDQPADVEACTNTALRSTSTLTGAITRLAELDQTAILGALYVLEGSRMGSRVLAPRLCSALALPAGLGNGLDYHLQGAEETPPRLQRLKRAIDAWEFDNDARARVVDAAITTMQGLYDIYQELGEQRP